MPYDVTITSHRQTWMRISGKVFFQTDKDTVKIWSPKNNPSYLLFSNCSRIFRNRHVRFTSCLQVPCKFKPPAEHQTLEHDVVLIGDSNTKNIDMDLIGRGTSRKRFTCYTIPEAKQFLNTANIIRQPKKVVLHLGTNDVKVGPSIDHLRDEYNELIVLARSKFPDARIYVSSVFCRMRKDDKLNDLINMLNDFLEEYCDRTPMFTLVNNSNIHHRDMRDPLHVNATGFYTFLCNLRVTVFGEKSSSSRRR